MNPLKSNPSFNTFNFTTEGGFYILFCGCFSAAYTNKIGCPTLEDHHYA